MSQETSVVKKSVPPSATATGAARSPLHDPIPANNGEPSPSPPPVSRSPTTSSTVLAKSRMVSKTNPRTSPSSTRTPDRAKDGAKTRSAATDGTDSGSGSSTPPSLLTSPPADVRTWSPQTPPLDSAGLPASTKTLEEEPREEVTTGAAPDATDGVDKALLFQSEDQRLVVGDDEDDEETGNTGLAENGHHASADRRSTLSSSNRSTTRAVTEPAGAKAARTIERLSLAHDEEEEELDHGNSIEKEDGKDVPDDDGLEEQLKKHIILIRPPGTGSSPRSVMPTPSTSGAASHGGTGDPSTNVTRAISTGAVRGGVAQHVDPTTSMTLRARASSASSSTSPRSEDGQGNSSRRASASSFDSPLTTSPLERKGSAVRMGPSTSSSPLADFSRRGKGMSTLSSSTTSRRVRRTNSKGDVDGRDESETSLAQDATTPWECAHLFRLIVQFSDFRALCQLLRVNKHFHAMASSDTIWKPLTTEALNLLPLATAMHVTKNYYRFFIDDIITTRALQGHYTFVSASSQPQQGGGSSSNMYSSSANGSNGAGGGDIFNFDAVTLLVSSATFGQMNHPIGRVQLLIRYKNETMEVLQGSCRFSPYRRCYSFCTNAFSCPVRGPVFAVAVAQVVKPWAGESALHFADHKGGVRLIMTPALLEGKSLGSQITETDVIAVSKAASSVPAPSSTLASVAAATAGSVTSSSLTTSPRRMAR